jgi:hypothetical protein
MIKASASTDVLTESEPTPPNPNRVGPETCDWDALSGWFLALCLWAEPLLPAALWLVCTCRASFFQDFEPTASEAALADELAAAVATAGNRSRRCAQPPESTAPGLWWRSVARALRSILVAKPAAFRLALWSGIQYVRSVRADLNFAQPREEEIRALLDHLDVGRPDALAIAQRMLASIPGGAGVLARWQPQKWKPKGRVVTKIILFFSRVHEAAEQNGAEAAELAAELRQGQWELAGGEGGSDLRLGEFPVTTLAEIEQIIDDPTLAARGKVRAICQVLKQATHGTPVVN